MNYFGASINTSSVIAEVAGADIKDGAFRAVTYDTNGNVVLSTIEGSVAAGILLPETTAVTAQGESVTVQIKDVGYALSGAEISKGAELMVDATGRLITATAGKFIIGYAMESVAQADTAFSVQIHKSGYKA